MPFMGPKHHGLIRPAGLLTPVLVGFAQNATGNPTVPAHEAGAKLVSIAGNNNAHSDVEPSVSTANWERWTGVLGGTNRALAIWRTTATGAGTLCQWINAGLPRAVWVFDDADFDLAAVTESASQTDLDWVALTGMAPDCLVGAYAFTRTAQTNADAVALASFNIRISKESLPACWAGDSDPTLLDTFDPANGTWDSISSGQCNGAFSMKGAAA